MHLLVDEDVVGGDAGLAGVEPLPPGHAPGGHPQIGRAVDDHRALAAELEGHRGEVTGGGGHHHAADGPVAGVEEVVEPLGQQFRGLGHAAFDQGDGRGVEVAGHQAREQARGRRGDLGGLHHHGVAGGDGAGHGYQEELDRVVPRGDDQDHAEGFGDQTRPGRQGHQRRWHPPGPVPPAQVADHALDLAHDEGEVGDESLERRLAEVGLQGGEELVLVVLEHADELLELATPPGQRAGGARAVGGTQGRDGRGRRSGRGARGVGGADGGGRAGGAGGVRRGTGGGRHPPSQPGSSPAGTGARRHRGRTTTRSAVTSCGAGPSGARGDRPSAGPVRRRTRRRRRRGSRRGAPTRRTPTGRPTATVPDRAVRRV